jgi:ribosomal protein L29
MYDTLEEMEDEVKELKKLVSDLRVQVANKRDK